MAGRAHKVAGEATSDTHHLTDSDHTPTRPDVQDQNPRSHEVTGMYTPAFSPSRFAPVSAALLASVDAARRGPRARTFPPGRRPGVQTPRLLNLAPKCAILIWSAVVLSHSWVRTERAVDFVFRIVSGPPCVAGNGGV